jgi:stearoyl-CoA desaturase (delta-9 desaturase)
MAVIAGVAIPFLGCVAAVLSSWQVGWMNWLYLALLIGGWLITGLGITIGFHRLLSHRSFETHPWLRGFWAVVGASAAQGPPLTWCATHRKHHALSDRKGDPHSPHQYGHGWRNAIRGFVHAHIFWIFSNHTNDSMLDRYVPDLRRDPILIGVERSYTLCVLAGLCIPAIVGGLITRSWQGAMMGFLWGGLARIFVVHHVTWSINSICHTFGSRDYESADLSTNNFICGLLGHGEGWHNNHHAFPNSARHGLRWWQIDLSWMVILTMRSLHLVWNVQTPTQNALAAKRLGDSG